MHTTSATLLRQLRQLSDVEAWSRFVHLYTPVVYGWGQHMGLRHDDAVDLVQDVFAVMVQKLPEFDYDSHKRFRGWLWTVTRRRWIERRRRSVLPVDSSRAPDDVAMNSDEHSAFEEEEFRTYLLRQVVPTLRGNFQESTWQAFWRHVVDGHSVADVAQELGLSVASVYKAKLRVLEHLHRELPDLVDG
jgi:RNA polymerase sigma factor (sigma-70 family)